MESYIHYKPVRFKEYNDNYKYDSMRLKFYTYLRDSFTFENHPVLKVVYGDAEFYDKSIINGELTIRKKSNADTLHVVLWGDKYGKFVDFKANTSFNIYLNERNTYFYFFDSMNIKRKNLSYINSSNFIYKKLKK